MAVRYNKKNLPNELYFITFTILGWKHIFTNDKYYNLAYKQFNYLKNDYGNIIYEYVVMPNHMHLMLKLSPQSPLPPVLVQNIKRFLAYDIVELLKKDNRSELLHFFKSQAKKKSGAKHKLFRDKYDSLLIQSQKFFLEKLNYIHNNPCQVKWNLADNPEDYKYSSAANYILGQGHYQVEIMDF